MRFREPKSELFAAIFSICLSMLLISGCTATYVMRDPQALGKVPADAQYCGRGGVGYGIYVRSEFGATVPGQGTVILLGDDGVTLNQPVAAKDDVGAVITHGLFGD